MRFKLKCQNWKNVLLIKIPQSIELFTILKNVTYHLNQEENLFIDAAMCQRFKDITQVSLIQIFKQVLVDITKILNIFLPN